MISAARDDQHQHYVRVRARIEAPRPAAVKRNSERLVAVRSYRPQPLVTYEPIVDTRITVCTVLAATCEEFAAGSLRVTPRDVMKGDRLPEVIRVRHVAMFLARHMLKMKMPEIGRRFGGRHHTSVLYALRKMARLERQDHALAVRLAYLRRVIRAHAASGNGAHVALPSSPARLLLGVSSDHQRNATMALDTAALHDDVSAHVADVASSTDPVNGGVSTIGFMCSLFRKYKNDPVAVTALADAFDDRKTELAQAGVANTNVEPKPSKPDVYERNDAPVLTGSKSDRSEPAHVETTSGNVGVKQPTADTPSYVPPSAGDAGGAVTDGQTLADKQAVSAGATGAAGPTGVIGSTGPTGAVAAA